MEAYASRAASAYLHATRGGPRSRKVATQGTVARVKSAVRGRVKASLAARLKAKLRGTPAARPRPKKRRRP
jgi:hypothetical protein